MRTAVFLEFRPSTLAAGCLLMAIKQNSTKKQIGKKAGHERSKSAQSALTLRQLPQVPSNLEHPLYLWDGEVEHLTKLSLYQDIVPVYNMIKSRAKPSKAVLDL